MSIVQEVMLRSTDYLRYHHAIWRTRRSHNVILAPELQRFPSERPRLVGLWEKIHEVVLRDLCREVRLEANKLSVVQAGESFEQAKVFKARAVPRGLCANLINALALLAKQQEDGDGL